MINFFNTITIVSCENSSIILLYKSLPLCKKLTTSYRCDISFAEVFASRVNEMTFMEVLMNQKVRKISSEGTSESAARASMMHAFAGMMNALSGVMGICVLLALGVLVYLFSGLIGAVFLWMINLVGAILLASLAIYYLLDGMDTLNPTAEEVAAGITVKEYLLKKYHNAELHASKVFKKKVKEDATPVEFEAAFKKQALGLMVMHGMFTVLMTIYTVHGFVPGLGITAVVAGVVGTLAKMAQCVILDSLTTPMTLRKTRQQVIHFLVYGLPILYTVAVLLSYVF